VSTVESSIRSPFSAQTCSNTDTHKHTHARTQSHKRTDTPDHPTRLIGYRRLGITNVDSPMCTRTLHKIRVRPYFMYISEQGNRITNFARCCPWLITLSKYPFRVAYAWPLCTKMTSSTCTRRGNQKFARCNVYRIRHINYSCTHVNTQRVGLSVRPSVSVRWSRP